MMNKIDTGIQACILLWSPVFISPGWEMGLDFQYYILYETLLPVLPSDRPIPSDCTTASGYLTGLTI